jgi:beta-mannosidase
MTASPSASVAGLDGRPEQVTPMRRFVPAVMLSAVGPLAGIALADAFPAGGRAQWLAIAAVGFGVSLVAVLLFRDPRSTAPKPPLDLRTLASTFWFNPWRHPAFGWAWLVRFLIMCGYASSGYNTFFLMHRFGISAERVGTIVLGVGAVSVACIAVASVAAGYLSDAVKRQRPFVIFAGVLAAVALAAMSEAASITTVFIACALLGLGVGAFLAIDLALCVRVLPSAEDAGKDLAIINIANSLPQSLIPFAAPALLALGGYRALFLTLAVLTLLGAVAVLRVPEIGRENAPGRAAPINDKEKTLQVNDFELVGTVIGLDVSALPADGWLPAVVPGGVHESLLAAGRIGNPYQDRNENDVRWIEERDWWFRGSLAGPAGLAGDERARLVFHGLDTVADIWLNGRPLGHHENMFRPAVFDVTERLRDRNDLLLRFSPPLHGLTIPASAAELRQRFAALFAEFITDDAAPAESEGFMTETKALASLRRKAAFSWGWDFGPRVPSIGIWRPVELRVEKAAALTGHHLRTEAIGPGGRATVGVLVEADQFAIDARLTVRVELAAPSGRRVNVDLPVSNGQAHGTLTVPEAELWWTHDLGDPVLHDVTITLLAGETTLDRVTDRIGLRTIALDRDTDPEGGHVFRFILNGVPVFARGAAWLPADMLVGSVTADRVRALVGLARGAGMNMLRVWGGGIYEQDAFYRACDEQGVLVWQDFMFACIDYPQSDPALAAEVAREAEYQVKRLRNHPSLALWCGNNEVQLIHGAAYQNYEPGDWGYDFFYRLLPAAVAELDGRTPYWPGSPWGEDPHEGWAAANGVLDGDRHAWEVWHGVSFGPDAPAFDNPGDARHYRRYADDKGKFISEFGIHAAPELGTLRRCLPQDQLYVHSEAFDHHNKDNPKNKHDAVLAIVTGLPETIRQYVDFTMISQAEGLKFGVEHYRRRAPHCNGTLVWQFNDVWPGFSWSVVDHDLVPKAGYHYLSRAHAPLLASFRRDGDTLELWLSNSGRTEVTTTAAVTVAGFNGRGHLREDVTATVSPGESRAAWTGSGLELGRDRYAWVDSRDGAFPSNRLFFAEIKDIPFGEPKLDVTATKTGPGAASLTVTATGFAYFVHALTPSPAARFDTNYLDLRDGQAATIEVTGLPDDFDPATIEVHAWQPRQL